nr:MAG TPA: hypothetical protein [Caudoviricetes sp.]
MLLSSLFYLSKFKHKKRSFIPLKLPLLLNLYGCLLIL